MYLTYEEYTDMGGTLDDTAFIDVEYEARAYIDWITFNRLKKMYARTSAAPNEVKECIYHLVKLIVNKLAALNIPTDGNSNSYGLGVASQSNDGVSISFNVLSAKDVLDNSEAEINRLVNRYLSDVKDDLGHRLTYRGLYPDE